MTRESWRECLLLALVAAAAGALVRLLDWAFGLWGTWALVTLLLLLVQLLLVTVRELQAAALAPVKAPPRPLEDEGEEPSTPPPAGARVTQRATSTSWTEERSEEGPPGTA